MAVNEMDHDSASASASTTLGFEQSGPGQLLLQHRLSQLRNSAAITANNNTSTARAIAPSSSSLKDIANALLISGNVHFHTLPYMISCILQSRMRMKPNMLGVSLYFSI